MNLVLLCPQSRFYHGRYKSGRWRTIRTEEWLQSSLPNGLLRTEGLRLRKASMSVSLLVVLQVKVPLVGKDILAQGPLRRRIPMKETDNLEKAMHCGQIDGSLLYSSY